MLFLMIYLVSTIQGGYTSLFIVFAFFGPQHSRSWGEGFLPGIFLQRAAGEFHLGGRTVGGMCGRRRLVRRPVDGRELCRGASGPVLGLGEPWGINMVNRGGLESRFQTCHFNDQCNAFLLFKIINVSKFGEILQTEGIASPCQSVTSQRWLRKSVVLCLDDLPSPSIRKPGVISATGDWRSWGPTVESMRCWDVCLVSSWFKQNGFVNVDIAFSILVLPKTNFTLQVQKIVFEKGIESFLFQAQKWYIYIYIFIYIWECSL